MQYLLFFMAACALTLLTACAEKKDYAASSSCQSQGYAPGTQEYEDCVMEEKMRRLSQEQQVREEMQEQRRQQQILLKY